DERTATAPPPSAAYASRAAVAIDSGTTLLLSCSAAAAGSCGFTCADRAATAYASVVRMNPSGTGKLARTSSPRFAPLPPTRRVSAAETSARRRTTDGVGCLATPAILH